MHHTTFLWASTHSFKLPFYYATIFFNITFLYAHFTSDKCHNFIRIKLNSRDKGYAKQAQSINWNIIALSGILTDDLEKI